MPFGPDPDCSAISEQQCAGAHSVGVADALWRCETKLLTWRHMAGLNASNAVTETEKQKSMTEGLSVNHSQDLQHERAVNQVGIRCTVYVWAVL